MAKGKRTVRLVMERGKKTVHFVTETDRKIAHLVMEEGKRIAFSVQAPDTISETLAPIVKVTEMKPAYTVLAQEKRTARIVTEQGK
jgi:hypothetical protein